MFRFLVNLLMLLFATPGFANNIYVADVSVVDRNSTANTMSVRFSVKWDNSWRISTGPANWDAAWVFVKYQVGDGAWKHATIEGNVAAPNGCTVETTDDTRGTFVYRSGLGAGNVDYQGIKLKWNYGADGVADRATVNVAVYAIEMVNIPQGAYYLGSGGSEPGAFYGVTTNTSLRAPYHVTSEAPITVGTSVGNLNYVSTNFSGDRGGPIPADFPKGYAGFYLMKYEVTQGEYVNFFNAQSQSQKIALDISDDLGKGADTLASRNTFVWTDSGEAITDSPEIPVAFMTARRTWAYLDWAGLRPMSELEYEKACRGPLLPVPNEYAWGNTNVSTTTHALTNFDSQAESITNLAANTAHATYDATVAGSPNTTQGPTRVGIFAGSSVGNSRQAAGASYYGVMELSGNLYEMCTTVGDARGRLVKRDAHGDGNLNENAVHDVPNWPSDTEGYGFHGGTFNREAARMAVSYRVFSAYNSNLGTLINSGFRGARTQD